jgi:hypothetical protein
MLHILRFFSSKCRLFHNDTFLGSCIIHILHTGCAKIKKKIRRQRVNFYIFSLRKFVRYLLYIVTGVLVSEPQVVVTRVVTSRARYFNNSYTRKLRFHVNPKIRAMIKPL